MLSVSQEHFTYVFAFSTGRGGGRGGGFRGGRGGSGGFRGGKKLPY